MTAALDDPGLVERLSQIPRSKIVDLACRADPAIWATERRGFTNAPLHQEWYRLMLRETRCCVIAPREHAKSEVFTVNQAAWKSIYWPGFWTYVFANTDDQAKAIKARIDEAVREADPLMVSRAVLRNTSMTVYANGSRVTCAGAGKATRGAHPDLVLGDDVLEESSTLTAHQRQKTHKWWFGTVSNMAHPWTTRSVGGVSRRFPPTRIFLVGTPFHGKDLLMSMRENPIYHYYRYAAEFDPTDLVAPGQSLAVEIAA